jgi:hypothetical protein
LFGGVLTKGGDYWLDFYRPKGLTILFFFNGMGLYGEFAFNKLSGVTDSRSILFSSNKLTLLSISYSRV